MALTLEELLAQRPTEFTAHDGQVLNFIDADTLQDADGNNLRLAGTDAPEVHHQADPSKGQEAGGLESTVQTAKLAKELGFTQLINSGDEGEFGRGIVDLVNPTTGQRFSRRLIEEGIQDIHHGYDKGNALLKQKEFSQFLKSSDDTPDDWSRARDMISEAAHQEGQRNDMFRQAQVYSGQIGDLEEIRTRLEAEGKTGEAFQIQQKIDSLSKASDAQIQYTDRYNISGRSKNPFSDSWNEGLIGVSESAFGIAELLGHSFGNETLQEYGEDGVARARARTGEIGKVLLDYKEVVSRDKNGEFQYGRSFSNALEYLSANLAQSLPYMAGTAGAAVAGTLAAPFVGGVAAGGIALGIPTAIYAGQTWNEMEGEAHEKNAAIAIGAGVVQASLDRLGLTAIFKKGVAPAKLMGEAVEALVRQGATREVAQQTVAEASRRSIAEFAGEASKVARNQLAAKVRVKEALKGLAVGGLGEASTEAAQEATAYTAAKLGGKDGIEGFDWSELNERLIASAIAGGTLGAGFTLPGQVTDAAAWADVAYRTADATVDTESQSALYAAEEKDRLGYVPTIEENAANAASRAAAAPSFENIATRAENYNSDNAKKSPIDRAIDAALNVSKLWQGATRSIFNPDLQAKSRSARILADMFGGNLQRVFAGSSFESSKHHRVAKYKNMVVDPQKFYSILSRGKKLSRSEKDALSTSVYAKLNAAVDKDGNFDPNLVPETDADKPMLVAFATQLNSLSNSMWQDQAKHNPELGFVKNYLLKYKALNKGSVHKNQAKFKQLLQKELNYSTADAAALVDAILNNDQVSDIDEAFSVVKGGIVPGSHKKRSLGLSEKAAFQEFMEQDIFSNLSQASKSAARYTAHRDYIGKDGAVVSKLLDDMEAEGVSKAEVDKVAAQIQDYLDAESGNYKRPKSALGKKAQAMQKNLMMVTTLAGLPLATISSLVELMLVNRGLRNDQVFGKTGSLQAIGKEFANTMVSAAEEVAGTATNRELDDKAPRFKTGSTELLKDLGYYEWDVGAATVTGVSETNPWQQYLYEGFFKWTGLTGWTNYTRAARASIAGDYINDKAEAIWKQRKAGSPRTREIQEAEEGLRNLGIDVDNFVEIQNKVRANLPLSPEEETFIAETMRESTFNFVNDAIALPGAANRPLIYQDPRFALFTQFQGFMATFTANHIPKLWGEYVKRGTPAMKYNAFALAVTMIMMGFLSQHLKDLIKYGWDDEDEKERMTQANPYLGTAEYIQRGVRASGLLGTGERVLDQFFPIYEQSSKNPGEWIFNTGTGESPALSYLKRAGGAFGKTISGDPTAGLASGLRLVPGAGPFGQQTKSFANLLTGKGWNYKGE